MLRTYIILVTALFISPIFSEEKKNWVAPASADTLKPLVLHKNALEKGKKIYEAQCFVCHGKSGVGDGIAGAYLKPKPADLTSKKVGRQSDGALFWKLTEGNSPMVSYKEILKEEQRWQVIQYIRTLTK